MRYFFVDGYNVINSWPELKECKDMALEIARNRLIDMLHNYQNVNKEKIFLVFDAHLIRGSIEKKEVVNNINVIFTKEGETADSYIERMVNLIGRKKEVMVVTDDNLEQQIVFQRGASRMTSLELYAEIVKNNKFISEETKKINRNTRNRFADLVEDEDILEKLEEIRKSSV